jgi:RNA polymerase sigma factor (sigma-70 family)
MDGDRVIQLPSHRRSSEGLPDFSAFYAEHAERVLVYLAKRCLDPEVAVDLMAETFAQAFASRRRYRGTSEAEAAAWIYGIARHQLSHYLRRGSAEQKALRRLGLQVPALDDSDQGRIEELAGLGEIRGALEGHFERLSAEQQAAVRLRVIDEMSYPEVARQLRVSEDAARARVSRGLRQLAASLDQALINEGGADNG